MNSEIPNNRDITYFAKTNFRSTEKVFGIKRKDRRQHMYILGKSGTGKSVLMSNLILQNIRNGEGVCVVDPHGELVEGILNSIPDYRMKDVIYFNPADTEFNIGFNVMQIDDPKYKHLVASGLMGIFTKIWANAWSSRMEYILNNAILALLDTPGSTLLGIPRLLVDKDYRQMIIGNLKESVVKDFWVHEYEQQWREQYRNEAIAPIQNKVGQFLSTSIIRNVVGQPKSTIDIFKIMNEGKIFLVNVSKGRIGEDNSSLLGGMIITKLQLAAMERVRIPEEERKDFYLYVDEFQNFATESFANILSEARKYRLNLTVAHQYIAQLENKDGSKVSDAVFGNVGTMIIFRVGADDADFLEKEFEPEFTAQDLVNLPNYHIYLKLMIDGVTSRPFSATTLPPEKIDASSDVKEKIIESSRNLYARPKDEVEEEIKRWSGSLQVGEGEYKYKSSCTSCKKDTMVPFEPKEGKPIYCRECMFKIRTGDLMPEKGFIATRSGRQEELASTSPLAMLGIEFTDLGTSKADPSSSNNKPFNNKNNKYNKNQDNTRNEERDNGSYKNKRKGPSPLLKNLLQKITNNKNFSKDKNVDKEKAIENLNEKENVPEKTISLSELKEDNVVSVEKNKERTSFPTKEASEEKKASLKDLLSKVNKRKEDDLKEADEIKKKEDVIVIEKNEKPIIKNEEVLASQKIELIQDKKELLPNKDEKNISEKPSIVPEKELIKENPVYIKDQGPVALDNTTKSDISEKTEINKEKEKEVVLHKEKETTLHKEKKTDFIRNTILDLKKDKENKENIKTDKDKKDDSKEKKNWQKKNTTKEVPEDVLRKVLE